MKKQFKKINDIWKRALKTFIQGFIASFLMQMGNLSNLDKTFVRSALIGALAGGISALGNYINNLLSKEEDK